MTEYEERQPLEGDDEQVIVQDQRWELLAHLQAILDPAMAGLGLVFLGLLLLDYSAIELSDAGNSRLYWALQAIWATFLIEFAVRLIVAPAKGAFLRSNWLGALSLALPFLRPVRAFRAARALRSLSLVRFLGGINRGIRVVRAVTRGRQFAWVGALTVMVMLAGAVGVRFFDRGVEDAPIQSFGSALWWSAAMVTTINNELYAVSLEARVLAILMRIFAVSVFGYITASIASYFIGTARDGTGDGNETEALRSEIAALRREIAAARRETGMDGSGSQRTGPGTRDAPALPADSNQAG
ncbi:MAG: ion transporter [Chloroflexota bacterium]|nr:ion transporter [Chloroflexota bacterium]